MVPDYPPDDGSIGLAMLLLGIVLLIIIRNKE